jgi:hypothetical protein
MAKRSQIAHTMNIETTLWIGLAQISSSLDNGLLEQGKGAYVNVLAIATNHPDFTDKVKKAITDLGLDFVNIEEVEPFSERIKNYEMNEKIINLAIEVNKTKELRFGDFHTFDD